MSYKYFNLNDLTDLQISPRTPEDIMFYGKSNNYENDIKKKIDKSSSLVRRGVNDYTNGNVQVIIPCPVENF